MTKNDIFYLDDTYIDKVNFANANNLTIEEIEPDENGRRFKFIDLPKFEIDVLEELRYKREVECFSILDKCPFWYEKFTDEQKEELKAWYQAWLDVTETMIVPNKPSWLK